MRLTKIWVRLMILTLTLLGPVMVLVLMLSSEQSKAIEFSAAESRGVEYHEPAWDVFRGMTEHRTLGAMVAAGNSSKQEAMQAKQREIDGAFAALVGVDDKLGDEMKTSELLHTVQKDWSAMKELSNKPGAMDLQGYMSQHNKLVYDMGRVITKMGNHSNLILDPDIDTYYLMDATQFKLPRLLDQLTQIQALGAAVQSRPADADGVTMTPLERAQIANAVTRADEYLREGLVNLEYTYEVNPSVRASLGGAGSVMQSSVNELLADATRKLSQPHSGGPDAWLASSDKGIAATASMFDSSLANLGQWVQARIDRLKSNRLTQLIGAGVVLVVALGMTGLISRSILSPLSTLRSTADRISLGELAAQIDVGGSDEVADLARTIVRMQESLKIAASEAGDL